MKVLPQNVLEIWDPQLLQDDEFIAALANYLNDLILNDFEKLIFILYKVDVDEKRLRNILTTNLQTDAGELLARLVVERQIQKINSRKASETSGGEWKEI